MEEGDGQDTTQAEAEAVVEQDSTAQSQQT